MSTASSEIGSEDSFIIIAFSEYESAVKIQACVRGTLQRQRFKPTAMTTVSLQAKERPTGAAADNDTMGQSSFYLRARALFCLCPLYLLLTFFHEQVTFTRPVPLLLTGPARLIASLPSPPREVVVMSAARADILCHAPIDIGNSFLYPAAALAAMWIMMMGTKKNTDDKNVKTHTKQPINITTATTTAVPAIKPTASSPRKKNAWNDFQRAAGGQGLSKREMSLLYSALKAGRTDWHAFRAHIKGTNIDRPRISKLYAQLKQSGASAAAAATA